MTINHNFSSISEEEISFIYNNFMIYDFLKEELKSIKKLKSLYKNKNYIGYKIEKDKNILGYCYIFKSNIILIDYLAINKKYRNQKLGSYLIEKIKNQYNSKIIVIEVEKINDYDTKEIKLKKENRIKFYLKNNFLKTNIEVTLFNVNYQIMINKNILDNKLKEELEQIYINMFSKEIFEKNVRFNI